MAARGKIAQMVEDEAARAEAEPEDEDENEDEDEDEDEDDATAEDGDAEEAEGAGAELSADEVQARIEAAHSAYEAALTDTLPDFAEAMHDCPRCNALGYVPVEAILADPDTVRCDKCRGHGGFETESLVPNNVYRQCNKCMGNGYVDRPPQLVVPEPFSNGSPNEPAAAAAVPPMPRYDPNTNSWYDPQGNLIPVAS